MSKTVEFQYSIESDRVKMVDIHPKEPLVIGALYTGILNMWNYESGVLLRSFETGTGLPVRCVRFIPRLQSFICGCDDMQVRVYNYNTMECTKVFQAHDDYIRSVAVHSQLPLVLTASDDMTICQWDWTSNWALTMTYDAHFHYCMAVAFNPCDSTTFASGSLDGTVKVWTIGNPIPNYQLGGHEDGVNCIDYYPFGDKPYLLSGSDDETVRLWDYQTKACLQVFTHHTANVSAVLFHPDKPLIITLGEDGEMKVISAETFRLVDVVNTQQQRGWSLGAARHSLVLIAGYDTGISVLNVGESRPVYSMDSNGRILVAHGKEVCRLDVKSIPKDTADGEPLQVTSKELGILESNSPQHILHGPGGQNIALLDSGNFSIVSTLALRQKAHGTALSFAWGSENGSFAVLRDSMNVTIYKSLKPLANSIRVPSSDKLFPGPLLGVRSTSGILFYDWATLSLIMCIEEKPQYVEWNPSGEFVLLATESSVYTLKFNSEMVQEYLENNQMTPPNGIESSFELVEEVEERVRVVFWAGDCLVFVNQAGQLNYYIGGDIYSIAVLSRDHHFLGYLPKENRILFIDREDTITTYRLQVGVVEYMAAVVRKDFDAADELLQSIEKSHWHRLAQFLENRGHLDKALQVSTDDDHRFDLAIHLKNMSVVKDLTVKNPSTTRWKQFGDLALTQGYISDAIDAYRECNDLNGLLLIYTSINDVDSISNLGDLSLQWGKTNLAFTCFHLAKRYSDNVDVLIRTGKGGEAAFYARTYCQARIGDAVFKWKASLITVPRIREAIANPSDYPNLFPMLKADSPSNLLHSQLADQVDNNQNDEEKDRGDTAVGKASTPQISLPAELSPLSRSVSHEEASRIHPVVDADEPNKSVKAEQYPAEVNLSEVEEWGN